MLSKSSRSVSLLVLLFAFGCKEEAVDPWINFTPFTVSYDTYHLAESASFTAQGENHGLIDFTNELSGLAESKMNANALWAHADSGNPDFIYLVDQTTGKLKASYRINGVTNDDWEDIAVGPGPKAGVSYIYLADIGDNKSERSQHIIYRFPEPLYATAHEGKTIDITLEVDKIIFNYPDGRYNAETLLLDPIERDLYIVTKYGAQSYLFVARYPQPVNELVTLTKVGAFPFRETTAGDISSDGKRVLIKTYDQIFYWNTSQVQPIWKLLSQTPELAPYHPMEAQGEAIAWSSNGYYTSSEKKGSAIPPLYFYSFK